MAVPPTSPTNAGVKSPAKSPKSAADPSPAKRPKTTGAKSAAKTPKSAADPSPAKRPKNSGAKPPAKSPSTASNPSTAKRTKNPGVRIVGGRIYDSENGKTCHQCRQKTRDIYAPCKATRENGKPCPICYCHKCLLGRYGEKVEEVVEIGGWTCPKCRNVCNCSFCMKKKGEKPTGMLIYTAKATGFSSVLDLLHEKGAEVAGAIKAQQSILKGSPSVKKGSGASKKRDNSADKENSTPEQVALKKEKKRTAKRLMLEDGNGGNLDSSAAGKKQEYEDGNGDNLDSSAAGKKQENEDGNGDNLDSSAAGKEQGNTEKEVSSKVSGKEENKKKRSAAADIDNADGRPKKNRKLKNKVAGLAKKDSDDLPKMEASVPNAEADSDTHMLSVPNAEADSDTRVQDTKHLCEEKKEVVLPHGVPFTTVAGVEWADEDVGPALQFLEFCRAFGKALELKKGEAEAILRELAKERGRRVARVANSLSVHFQIKLLSLIQDIEEGKSLSPSSSKRNSWLHALKECIDESLCDLKDFPSDFSTSSAFLYDDLVSSAKLRVLNFLCDEALCTQKMRSLIDEDYTKFLEKKREISEQVFAARKSERDLKQKLKDDAAKALLSLRDGTPLTISDHDNLILKIKTEAEEAHAQMIESLNLLPKKKQSPDALRTTCILLEGDGHLFWKLRSCNTNILVQVLENVDSADPRDRWFICNDEEGKLIEKHVSLRNRRRRNRKSSKKLMLCTEIGDEENARLQKGT